MHGAHRVANNDLTFELCIPPSGTCHVLVGVGLLLLVFVLLLSTMPHTKGFQGQFLQQGVRREEGGQIMEEGVSSQDGARVDEW